MACGASVERGTGFSIGNPGYIPQLKKGRIFKRPD